MDDCGVAESLEGVACTDFVGVLIGVRAGDLVEVFVNVVAKFPAALTGVRITPSRRGEPRTAFNGLLTPADGTLGDRHIGISTDNSLLPLGVLFFAPLGLAVGRNVVLSCFADASS